jgi:F-type H+-transporting ATPase subunit b
MREVVMVTETAATPRHAEGMPQLDFSTFPNQIFWLLVTLVVIYLIMSRVALPRIEGVLQQRKNTIQGDLDKAEELKSRAIEAEENYQKILKGAGVQAQEIIIETKSEIKKKFAVESVKVNAEIGYRFSESEKVITGIHNDAAVHIKEIANEVAGEIVRSVIPSLSSKKSIENAVANHMKV